jgi:glutamyl-tRNA synthetase
MPAMPAQTAVHAAAEKTADRPTITRFAPSPTGFIHVGNLRTALMNWMIARKSGGTFILRLDDTDQERSKQEYADGIMEDLEWLGLTWDRLEKQSLRFDRYRAAAEDLKAAGRFYECFESPVELDLKRKKLLNMGRPPVYDRTSLHLTEDERARMRAEGREGYWRFLLDQNRIEWPDGILGPISIDAASVSDPVLIRADGQILYTFASSVDDIDMGVTSIVRGADHVTNTATQIQIMQALGGVPPAFAHHSLLTGPQGEALSKRLGTLSLRDLRARGVEPMALLSLMARLGSSHPVELATSHADLIAGFDLSSFGAAPTKFDPEDLFPLTRAHVRALPHAHVAARIHALGVPAHLSERFWEVTRESITVLADLGEWWEIFADGAVALIDPEDEAFVAQALELLPEMPWTPETWGQWTEAVKAATGRKGRALFRPLRRAMTGRDTGPEMADVMPMLKRPRRR